MIKDLIIVRGGGDLATGTIHRLWAAGFEVLVLETDFPAAIRRQVSVCEAVYSSEVTIEGMTAILIHDLNEAEQVLTNGNVPVFVDPKGESIAHFKPQIVIDAIMAKKNLGTTKAMAPVTVALGPGFEAGVDVDFVIETKRGHDLGRIIKEGFAVKNTGVPGNIGGYTIERVIKAPVEGKFVALKEIGAIVAENEVIAKVEASDGSVAEVTTKIPGILRGILKDGYQVTEGFKIADVDPRLEELKNCFTISDKSRCIAGGVLEICVATKNRKR